MLSNVFCINNFSGNCFKCERPQVKIQSNHFSVSKESFENLLEDDVFVDYLNKFLALPVFGQRVVYRKKHDIFLFEPPLPEQEDFKENGLTQFKTKLVELAD